MKNIFLVIVSLFIVGCSYTPPKKLTMADYYGGMKQEVEAYIVKQRQQRAKKDNSLNERDKAKMALSLSYQKRAKEYAQIGEDTKALEYYKKALKTRDRDFDYEHPKGIADFYNEFSLFLHKIRAYREAFYYQKKASERYVKLRLEAFKRITNNQKEQFLDKDTYSMYNLISLAFDNYQFLDAYSKGKKYPHNDEVDFALSQREAQKEKRETLRTAFKFWLISKGEISNRESYLMESRRWASSEGKLLIDVYLKKTREYANLYLLKLYEREDFSKEQQSQLDEITKERSILEEYLTPYIDNYSNKVGGVNMHHPKTIELSVISENLNSNELYLDFVRTKEYYYLFSFDKQEHIGLYRLGSVQEIEPLIKRFRENLEKNSEIENLDSRLYQILLARVTNLNRYQQLIISPDGLLNLIPFETLKNREQKYLIEESSVVYLLSGKELFKDRESDNEPLSNREIVSLSYLDYRFKSEESNSNVTSGKKEIDRVFNYGDKLSRLEDTKDEAQFMKDIFEHNRSFTFQGKRLKKSPVTLLTGKNGTKENLFALSSPQIVHFSTHSFYGEDDNQTEISPLLKSSLALSEYNAMMQRYDTRGVMSALEFSTLNLKSTELVLFSSCESGLGDIHSSEGVSGLNRGARVSGARRVISTLWSVDERASLKLTKMFYRDLIKNSKVHTLGHQYRDKFYYANALTSTKRKMIKQGLHPFYWAGFVMYGVDSFFYKKSDEFFDKMLEKGIDRGIDKVIDKSIEKAVEKVFDKLFKF